MGTRRWLMAALGGLLLPMGCARIEQGMALTKFPPKIASFTCDFAATFAVVPGLALSSVSASFRASANTSSPGCSLPASRAVSSSTRAGQLVNQSSPRFSEMT